ncbi:porin family protein, partial [Methylobacterium sp. WL7]
FDRTLVYGTGGFAYGSGSADRSFGGYAGNDSFRTGSTVGGDDEFAVVRAGLNYKFGSY